jgi:shikimate 5-dehydrogenase
MPKKQNLHKNELNTTFFLFGEPLKDSKSPKIFKINLTFRFDKL